MTTVRTSVHREAGEGTLWLASTGKFDVLYEIETEQRTIKHPGVGIAAGLPAITGRVTSPEGSPLELPKSVKFPANGFLIEQAGRRLELILDEDSTFRVTAISYDS